MMKIIGQGKPRAAAHRFCAFMGFSVLVSCSSVGPDGLEGSGGAEHGNGGSAGTGEVISDRTEDGFEPSLVLPAPSSAQACTSDGQCASGFCTDGICCDMRCDNVCMACTSAKKGGGLDGVCGSVKYDTDPDGECPTGRCDGKNVCKKYNGFACTSSAQCLSNYCVDGTCCGNICMNSCQACSAAKKGGGSDGVCGNIATNTDPDNECNPGECNGSGACNASPQATSANGAPCTSAAQCASGYCADGVCCDSWCLGSCQACTATKKGSGTDGTCGNIKYDTDPDDECWGGSCDGKGACKQYNGVWCSQSSQCLSGYCVDGFCCGNVCVQQCYACSTAKKGQGFDGVCGPMSAGRDPENECNPGECNGSGSCNQPQIPAANGTACVTAAQCASGNCVDGVCCDTTCAEKCTACTATKKGNGSDGTCGPIISETDPDNECNGGRCDGSGACRYYNGAPCTSTQQCFSKYCVDGVCCGNVCASSCQACTAAKKGSGWDGACGNISNATDPDNECNPGECNGSGACNQPQTTHPNGTACTLATQCVSGYCADGVCCDSPCPGTCLACTAAKKGQGSNGTCGLIVNGADPDDECTNGNCNGSGACVLASNQPNGVACINAAQCASGNCVDSVCCDTACAETCVACSAAKKGSGSNGTCGNIKYDTDPNDECYGGGCSGSGACAYYNGLPCATNTDCLSTYCVDGFCCNNHCGGTCYACSAAKKGAGANGACGFIAVNTDPDNECASGDCNGSGVCTVLAANGAACNTNSQCTSGNCADGVCCDTACTETCQACSAAKKGQGSDGTCGAIVAGTDPDDECLLGECNGSLACTLLPDGNLCSAASECASGFCVDDVCCNDVCSGLCNGCSATKKGQGTDGVCDVIIAGADPDDECTNSNCDGTGACALPLLGLGESCTMATQCDSAHCIDGVCCDTACTDTCQACTAATKGQGTDGACGNIKFDTDPDNECLNGGCNGSGACSQYNGVPCATATQCLSGYCVDGVCCGNSCTAPCKACTTAKKGSGSDGVCGTIATNTDPDHECSNTTCDGSGACSLISCTTGNQCLSGFCGNGYCELDIVQAVGGRHTCALVASGNVKCWGENDSGELGLGNYNRRGDEPGEMGSSLPYLNLGTGKTAVQLAANDGSTCALLNDGTVKCWGNNGSGQLGQGHSNSGIGGSVNSMGDNLAVTNLGTGKTAKQISMGGAHACALLHDGSVKCWGHGYFGQLGLGDMQSRGDTSGEMGDNLPTVDLGTGKTAIAISAGKYHTCAILNDNSVKCWGEGGKLGLGHTITLGDGPGEMGNNLPVVDLGTGKTAVQIGAGGFHTCALLNDGSVKCWGVNSYGALGLGDANTRGDNPGEMGNNLPAVSLGTGKTAKQLTVGHNHTCTLLNDNTTKCWGMNFQGQLGIGNYSNKGDQPNEMGDFLTTVDFGTGRIAFKLMSTLSHSCAILDNGTLKCWGHNYAGQLGYGDTVTRGGHAADMGDSLPTVSID